MKKNGRMFLTLGLTVAFVCSPIEARSANFKPFFKNLSKVVTKITIKAEKAGNKSTRWAEKEIPKKVSTGASYTVPCGANAINRQVQHTMQLCPICHGKGKVVTSRGCTHPCNRCGGVGRIRKSSTNGEKDR